MGSIYAHPLERSNRTQISTVEFNFFCIKSTSCHMKPDNDKYDSKQFPITGLRRNMRPSRSRSSVSAAVCLTINTVNVPAHSNSTHQHQGHGRVVTTTDRNTMLIVLTEATNEETAQWACALTALLRARWFLARTFMLRAARGKTWADRALSERYGLFLALRKLLYARRSNIIRMTSEQILSKLHYRSLI